MTTRTLWTLFASLAFVLAATAPAASQQSTAERSQTHHEAKTRELALAYRKAYEAGDWQTAIRVGYELTQHDPRDGRSAYNLACAYALDGQHKEALKWVYNAAREGYANPELMKSDADLEPIRQEPRFREALALVRANRSADFQAFQAWWDRRPLDVYVPDGVKSDGAPLIVALHGYGSEGDEIASRWKGVASEAGAVLVAPESGRPAPAGEGFQWTGSQEPEWVILRTIDRVEREHGIDAGRVILTGYSQGAFVALRFALKYPEKVAGVVSVAGLYDQALMPFNRFKEDEPLPRFVLMIGADDENVQTMREMKDALEARDADVRLEVYEGLGHAFPNNSEEELGEALSFALPASDEDDDARNAQ